MKSSDHPRAHRPARQLATLLVLATALVRFRPAADDAVRRVAHPYHWVEQSGADRAIAEFAAGLLWLTALWLTAALLAAIWIERTGRSSQALRALARSTPRSLQRLVFAGVSFSLIASPGVASAATGAPITTPTTIAAPQWPTASATSAAPAPTTGPLPAPQWPLSAAATNSQPPDTSTVPTSGPASTIAGPSLPTTSHPPAPAPTNPGVNHTEPASPEPPHAGSTSPTGAPLDPTPAQPPRPQTPPPSEKTPAQTGETVLVRPGDSLWSITAQELGPAATSADIAIEWPHWYRANRRVIGSDPGVLHPGQRLVVPTKKG